jgi:hypothetical protein
MRARFLILSMLIALGCTEMDTSTAEDDHLQAWANEAELMAHRGCSSLRAPTEIRDRLLAALSGVRNGWSDAIPELHEIMYLPPWQPRTVSVSFSAAFSEGALWGYFPAWDSLNQAFAIDSIGRVEGTTERSYTQLQSDSLYNVEVMAAAYSEIEGIAGASPSYFFGDYSNVYPHVDTTWVSLLFRKAWGIGCPEGGCEHNEYWYFKCFNDHIEYKGKWDSSWTEFPDWWGEARANIIEFRPQ